MLHEWILSEFVVFFFVLGRMIGLTAFMPYLSMSEISGRFRFFAAVAFTYLLVPSLNLVAASGMSYPQITLIFIKELMVGFFIGLVGRLLLTILDITGTLISSQIGLSSATVMNPNMQGSTITSSLLTLFGTAIFLSLDLHHLMFVGFIKSYALFPLDAVLPITDMSQSFIQLFSKIFWFGIQLSLPFMIVFLVMQIAFGLLNRIIPQMQIFFISLPFQLWAGLFIFLVTCGAILGHFGKMFEYEFSKVLKIS